MGRLGRLDTWLAPLARTTMTTLDVIVIVCLIFATGLIMLGGTR
jgi:hypothetical protein